MGDVALGVVVFFFFFQAEDGIRDKLVTGVQTCALPISFCTQILGDMGAEVVKVERPARGDDARAWAPPYWGDESATFMAMNRNKKSLALDLKADGGLEVLRRSEEHTSELQSLAYLVCRLLLE